MAGGQGNGTKNSINVMLHPSSVPYIEFSTLTKHSQNVPLEMGVQKRVRKFTKVKRVIGQQDARLYVQDFWACNRIKLMLILIRKKNQAKGEAVAKRKAKGDEIVREMYFPKALQEVCILTASLDPRSHRRCSSSIILL